MIEHIKAFWVGIKDAVIYVVSPIAFVLGFIYFFVRHPKDDTQIKEEEKFNEDHAEAIKLQVEADRNSADALAAYDALRTEYLKGRHD